MALKDTFEFFKQLLLLTREVEENKSDNKEIRQELKDLRK